MAGPVYKFWRMRPKGAWYQLSEEEQNAHTAQIQEALEKVGGKEVIACTTIWADEQWLLYGVEQFPSVEAVQEHTQLLFEMGHFRLTEGESTLGIEWQPA